MTDQKRVAEELLAEEMRRRQMIKALAGADKELLRELWAQAEELRIAEDEAAFNDQIFELYFNIRDYIFEQPEVLLPASDEPDGCEASTVIQ